MFLRGLLVIVLIVNVGVQDVLLFVGGTGEGVLYLGGVVELHVFLSGYVIFVFLFLVSFIIDYYILTVEFLLRNMFNPSNVLIINSYFKHFIIQLSLFLTIHSTLKSCIMPYQIPIIHSAKLPPPKTACIMQV